MEQEQQVADSGQDVSTDTGSDAGFDLDQAADSLAGDLFPTSEKSTEFDDAGDVVDHVDETEIQEDAAKAETTETKTQEETEPAPKSWPKEMHDHWSKTPKEVRDYWNTREKQMLDGLDQYKGDAAYGKSMKDAITPYMALIQAQGIDAPKAVQTLLNAHYRLSVSSPSQKAQMLDYIAKQYGIDRPAAKAGEEQQQSDPRYQQLEDRLHGLQQHITHQSQAAQKQEQERIANEVNAFASDKAHPYFDEVADDMIPFIRAGASIQDAYDKAVWANPVSRAKEQARVQQDQQAEIKRKAQEAADAAKKAASANIRSRDTRRTPTEQSRATIRNLDNVMTDVMKEIKARSH